MANKLKKAIIFFLKPKAIFFGVAIFLLIYISVEERKSMEIVGCWDCGWETRQAFYLLIASMGILIGRFWGAAISVLASVKVIYSIGAVAFWNNMAEVHGGWRILKESLRWSYQAHPEYFVEILIAMFICSYAVSFLWRNISRRYSSSRTTSNNSFNASAS
ncbi:MAG TPA: hypothetical protein VFQ47_01735 [Nitrososphaera sp.]|jgi:hypothetical protein|nr:hypothetical protein [Nitrososphaera sp.]